MSRLWSSSSSDLRVTFSVASTVRSATSRRICSIERRVSCSMSRRVCSISSSRFWLASTLASSWTLSDALRARPRMSSACSRASRSRSRYSCRSRSASTRVRSAASIDSAIARRRLRSAAAMRGYASLRRISSVMPNAISVQIITPMPGWTRKFPPPDDAAMVRWCRAPIRLREEEGGQAEDERVEHDRLGQGEAEPLDRRDLVAHLGLTCDRLDYLAEDVADADAGPDRAEPRADAEGEALGTACLSNDGNDRCGIWQIHESS